jgi:hypothetical protein
MTSTKHMTREEIDRRTAAMPALMLRMMPAGTRTISRKAGVSDDVVRTTIKKMRNHVPPLCHIGDWEKSAGTAWSPVFHAGDGPDEPKPVSKKNTPEQRAINRRRMKDRRELINEGIEPEAAEDSQSAMRALEKTHRWIETVALTRPPATPFSMLFDIQNIHVPRKKQDQPPRHHMKTEARIVLAGKTHSV